MMKWIWGGMLIIGFCACFFAGGADTVILSLTSGAQEAAELSLSLVGAYMLWMGLMKLCERSGIVDKLARLVRPAIKKLFPDSPDAAAPITLNLAMNFFGMGSAATPFGLAAMKELEKYNSTPGRATRDMCMFLALNAAALELMPTSVIALRSAYGSADSIIILPTFITSIAAFVAAAALCSVLGRRR